MIIDRNNFYKNIEHFLAVGCGLGLLPKAPGTWGTFLGIPIFIAMSALQPATYVVVSILIFLFGIRICHKTATDLGVHDHPSIVFDEVLGYLVTMFMIPASFLSIIIGFILFRIFDILKPFPIKWIDKKIHGGFGIMLDDALAGIFANICLHILFLYF